MLGSVTARPPPFIFRGQFTYAPTLRPAGFATVPAGFTEFGPPTDDYPHGTVSYARPLRSEDVEHFDLEPLDPDDPMIWKRAFQTYRDEVYRTFSKTKGFEQPRFNGGRSTLTYSTRPNVKFQLTYWEADWTPTGHLDLQSFDEAADELWAAVPTEEIDRRLEAALWKRTRDGSTTARKGNPVSIDSTESPELASPEPELLAQLREENPEALLANGFEAAFVGICRRFGQPPLALYDRRKCLAILMADGTSEDDAEEYFEFNTIGAWMGENTPCFADLDGEKKGDSGDAETR